MNFSYAVKGGGRPGLPGRPFNLPLVAADSATLAAPRAADFLSRTARVEHSYCANAYKVKCLTPPVSCLQDAMKLSRGPILD